MRMQITSTFAAASLAATMAGFGAITAQAAPAAPAAAPAAVAAASDRPAAPSRTLKKIKGKTGCFTYSYNDNGNVSVTVHLHNRCKRERAVKIRVAQGSDACFWVKGGDYRKKVIRGIHPTIREIKQVKHC